MNCALCCFPAMPFGVFTLKFKFKFDSCPEPLRSARLSFVHFLPQPVFLTAGAKIQTDIPKTRLPLPLVHSCFMCKLHTIGRPVMKKCRGKQFGWNHLPSLILSGETIRQLAPICLLGFEVMSPSLNVAQNT